MHELGIARNLLDLALAHAGGACIEQIRIENGIMSGVEEHALRFAFAALAKGTCADRATLVISTRPLRCFCGHCKKEFECEPLSYYCPECGRASGDIRAGRELQMVSLEVA